MFLGDGMSISTLKAARLYLGQSRGEDGERTKLAMEYFPYSGLSKVIRVYAIKIFLSFKYHSISCMNSHLVAQLEYSNRPE